MSQQRPFFKNAFKNLIKNKIQLVAIIILVFITSFIFTLAYTSSSRINRSYQNFASPAASNLHDL
ncbi:ABC transporter permease [Spiroplasma clarkii]|uniref:hypothetical protein n=1 Tax=Spiroplasma clarkii TaxID=2139 RepID=UPI000B54C4AB|nr:hypothetical protein [Spiroplasma clarkii]ARU92215.1 ABC transporter permease [Spiroplasma clarkii]